MRANNNSTEMPISWTYGIIWSIIMAIGAIALRYALWYKLVWMGDIDVFSDTFCSNSIALLCVSAIVGVAMYLMSYSRYKKLAARNIMDLHGVCHNKYGRMWVLPLILTFVLELVWTIICAVILIFSCELDIVYNDADMTVILTFALINAIGLVMDVILFAVGNAFFKPKEVMEKK